MRPVFQRVWRFCVGLLRGVFIVLLLIIPLPVGEMMVRLLNKYRRNQVAQTVQKPPP